MELSGIRYGTQIEAAARAHGLDPKLLAAVAAQETGGPGSSSGNNIVGDGGHGHGIFQIDDRTWGFAKTTAAMDPAANADEAASILKDDLDRYGGNVHAALSAYNSGSPTATGTTTTWGDGATLGYADSVMRHYAALNAEPSTDLAADAADTSAGVNALANYANAAGSSTPAPEESSGLEFPPLLGSFTAAPPIQYTSPQLQAAESVGQQADKSIGDLVDASDGMSDDDDGAGGATA